MDFDCSSPGVARLDVAKVREAISVSTERLRSVKVHRAHFARERFSNELNYITLESTQPTYSINCHTPLFSSRNVVPVSRILVMYGTERVLRTLVCNAAAKRGEARHERYPRDATALVWKSILRGVSG